MTRVALSPVALAVVLLTTCCAARAQIQAAPGHHRPVIDNTANGVPLVQIAPPNAAGLSHNQYQQFNVDRQGAILNNAGAPVQTQLGGWVGGNPQLMPGGGARIILNEVTSAHPSALRGFVEVAGQRADVVVSNPNGILVDGAGFINASRGILTTGVPVLGGNGALDGFRVTQGTIAIGRDGFNDTATGQVDLITRSLRVNGEMYANELNAVTGTNNVRYADLDVQIIQGSGNTPAVAIDVGALGGMYANKIWLRGTEAGVGVASYGKMASSAGDLRIDSQGRVTLGGATSSSANLTVTAQTGIDNSGTAYARHSAELNSAADIVNSGTVAAGEESTLLAPRIASTGTLAAGLDQAGAPAGSGNLRVQAAQAVALTGNNLATQHITLSGANIDLQGATIQAGGAVTAVATAGALDHSHAKTSAGGKITLSATGNLDNRDAHTVGGDDISMTAAGIDAAGSITQAGGNISIDVGSGDIGSPHTVVTAGGNLHVRGGNLDFTGAAVQAGGNVTLAAGNLLTQDGKLIAGGNIDLRVDDTLNNAGGRITSGNTLRLLTDRLINNNGTLETAGAGDLDVTGTRAVINAQGSLHSAGNLDLRTGVLTGDGAAIAGGDLTIALSGDYTQSAANTFNAAGSLLLSTTGILTNEGILAGGKNTIVTAASIINQTGGLVNSNGLTVLSANDQLTNLGRIYGDDIALAGNTVTNDMAAVIAARNTLDIGAQAIINREHALLKSEGDMTLGGTLDDAHKATGTAASVTNSSATIDSGGKLAIAAATLINTNAHFATQIVPDTGKTRSWTEYEIDGSPHIYAPDEVHLANEGGVTKLVVNSNGARYNDYTTRHITETARSTVITQTDPARILAQGDMTLTGGTITNDKSVIIAGGKLTGQIDGVDNGGTNPQGELFVSRAITAIHHTTERCAGGTKRCNKESVRRVKVDLPVTHFDLAIWSAAAHTAPAGVINPGAGQTVTPGQAPPVRLPPVSYAPGSVTPQFGLPDSTLYIIQSAPGNPYLVVTDPAYANYRNFLSSDYLLDRMGMDPAFAHKRLGDGYYEQQSVNDQILQLTGRKTLGAYGSNEAQFQALMDAGVAYARQFGLLPGMSLSAAQMAALTTDLIWLVEQSVQLADGSAHTVLTPVVYLSRLHADDVRPTGALIAANDIDLAVNGTLSNAGTLRAGGDLVISAGEDIVNVFGTMSAGAAEGNTLLLAGRDISNQSGLISGHRVGMLAGRDIHVETVVNNATGAPGTQIALDKTAVITADTLTAQAGRDITLNAAAILTSGDADVVAQRDINLGAVTTQDELNVTYDARNHLYKRQEQVNGTIIDSGGNLTFAAGGDLNSHAAYVNADRHITAMAGGSILVGTATQASHYDQEVYTASSGPVSSHSVHSKDRQIGIQSVGTTFSGDTVSLHAGQDISVTGSNVVSSAGTLLAAAGDIRIAASQDSTDQTYSRKETTSGVFSGGGVGVSFGNRSLEIKQTSKQITHQAATVGSIDGDVIIAAGNAYTQTGSNVIAMNGDIDIAAGRVDINTATDMLIATQDTHFEQSGLTLQVTSPVLSALQSMKQMKLASEKTKDTRLLAMAGVTAGMSAVNAVDTVAKNPSSVGGFNISLSLGTSKSDSHFEQSASTSKGSAVTAGGNVNIVATGQGDRSDLTVVGSSVTAKDNIVLNADHDITLLAGTNTAGQHSTNSNASASVGVGFAMGEQNGFTLNAGVSGGRGNADGNDVGYTNTRISAGKQLATSSGNDTTLKGAVVTGEQVTTTVGNDLSIESLQDTSVYNSEQKSVGAAVSLCIPPFCAGSSSGSVNTSQSKIDGNFASVSEQSGIKAGDGGFKVSVTGNTEIKGGQIAGTDQSVNDSRNSLTTQNLTISDIHNQSDHEAISQSAGVGYGNSTGLNGTGVGIGNLKGSESSVTRGGVSGIAGDTAIRSDQDTSGKLTKNWDGQQLQEEAEAEMRITEAFGKQAALSIGDYVTGHLDELNRQIKEAEDDNNDALADQLQQEADRWSEGGAYRTMLHAAAGGLTGGLAGAAGATTASLVMPLIGDYINGIDAPDAIKKALAQVMAGALGATVGGMEGLAAAINTEANNRELHQTEKDAIKKKANGDAEAEKRLTEAACYLVKCWAQYPEGSKEHQEKHVSVMAPQGLKNEIAWLQSQQEQGLFVYSTANEIVDYTKSTIIPGAMNGVKVAAGGVSVVTGGTICTTTGVGCLLGGGWMIAFGASNIYEGGNGLYNQYHGNGANGFNPIRYGFNQALPDGWGNPVYAIADFLVGWGALGAQMPLNIGVADGLNRPKSIFGATTSNFNNIKLNPLTKMPFANGTQQNMLLLGVGVKGNEVVNQIKGSKP